MTSSSSISRTVTTMRNRFFMRTCVGVVRPARGARPPRCHRGVYRSAELPTARRSHQCAPMIALAHDFARSTDPYHVSGDPNGLVFDADTDTLYAADARSGAIWALDGNRRVRVARIESDGVVTTRRISGIAATPYGTLYVARLGHGRAGALFRVEPDGTCMALDGIDARFWRLGLHYDARAHVVYSTQFMKSRSGP